MINHPWTGGGFFDLNASKFFLFLFAGWLILLAFPADGGILHEYVGFVLDVPSTASVRGFSLRG